METPHQYREYAEICERLAKVVQNEVHRKVLEQMAREWRRLADKPD
jgi:dihydroneopterin aldolase